MANTNNTNDYLANYIIAVNENNYDDVIKILTSKIKNTPSNNKTALIAFLTTRTQAFFRTENYKKALNDCIALRLMGYQIEDEEDMALIEFECKHRVNLEETAKELNYIPIKFRNGAAASWANKVKAADPDKIFKGNSLQNQGSNKRKKC